MKAITLTAPWAWAVAHAGKDIENRKTRCPSLLGQRIAIHAGVVREGDAEDIEWMDQHGLIPSSPVNLTHGAIVAVATIIGWVEGVEGRTVVHHPLYDGAVWSHEGAQSSWFTGPIGWLLHDVRALATPIPTRGKQGIWTVDAGAKARILAQLGGA